MTLVVYDYQKEGNDVIHKEVQHIKDLDEYYLVIFYENGEYTSIAKDDYSSIKIM